MGQATDGILAYGYDLGGEGWKIREADEHGLLALDWYDDEAEDSDEFQEAAEKRLLAAAGFTETDWAADGYFARERQAKADLGVEFEVYCSDSCQMFLLAAHVITVHRGSVEPIDMAELGAAPAAHGWDAKLSAALTVLGITPEQERPMWLLASYWG